MFALATPTFTSSSTTYTDTSASAVLTWNSSSDENLDYYRVTCSPSPQSGSNVVDVTASENSTTFILDLHINYTFTLVAVAIDSVDNNSPSASYTLTTLDRPDAPTSVFATTINDVATVTWIAPENTGGSSLTHYTVYIQGTEESYNTANGLSTSLTIPGLSTASDTESNSFIFYVTASNSSFTSIPSLNSNGVEPISGATNFSVLGGDTSAIVSWSPTLSSYVSNLNYSVTWEPNNIGSSVGSIITNNDGSMQATISGLLNDSPYIFNVVVSGMNEFSSGISSISDVIMLNPLIDITATAGDASASVSWTNSNLDEGINKYVITSNPGSITAIINDGTVSNGIINGLTNGTSYTFSVSVYNVYSIVSSLPSDTPVTPIGTPSVPQNVSVSSTPNTNTVVVNWEAPEVNGGASLTYIITGSNGVINTTSLLTSSFTGLSPGGSYSFTVKAYNGTQYSSSVTSNLIIPTNVPNAPSITNVVAGLQSVTVYWNPSSNNNGRSITSYTIYGAGLDTTINVEELIGQPTPYQTTISGLTQGVLYNVYMKATNVNGNSSSSNSSSYFTPYGAPYNAATNVIGTPANSQVSLSWTPPSNSGNSTIDYYIITYYPSNNTSNILTYQTPNSENTAIISGLTNGTEYTFKITTHNAYGLGPISNPGTAIPNLAANAPTSVSATSSNNNATVTWNVPEANAGTIDRYIVSWQANGSTQTQVVDKSSTQATIPNLTNGQSYVFYVSASNNVGSTISTSGSDPVTPNIAPLEPSVTATSGQDSSSTVSWTPNTSNGSYIESYTISYKTSSSSSFTVFEENIANNIRSFNITRLTNNVSYEVKITTINNKGTASTISNSFTPDVLPGRVLNITSSVPPNSIGQANISWSPATSSGSPITSYEIIEVSNNTVLASVSGSTTSTLLTGLPTGISTSFKIVSRNNLGLSNTAFTITSVTPTGLPYPPTNINVTSKISAAIIRWNAPTNTGALSITSYKVTSYENGISGQSITTSSTSRSATITGLSGGAAYTFSVTATNSLGTSPESSSSSPVIIGYSCFHSSSKILALKNDEEKYISISELKKGDLIKTYKHDYVKIFAVTKSIIKHNFSSDRVPEHLYMLPKSSFDELTDDLIITGYHAILVDDMNDEQCEEIAKQNKSNKIYMTDDKYRLFSYLEPKALLYNNEVGEVEIWHIALENNSKTRNYGIYANGLLVETLPICMIK